MNKHIHGLKRHHKLLSKYNIPYSNLYYNRQTGYNITFQTLNTLFTMGLIGYHDESTKTFDIDIRSHKSLEVCCYWITHKKLPIKINYIYNIVIILSPKKFHTKIKRIIKANSNLSLEYIVTNKIHIFNRFQSSN